MRQHPHDIAEDIHEAMICLIWINYLSYPMK
jgi:hypothetical protein